MIPVIAYLRVSTAEQAAEGVSLDAQRARLTAYAALYGLEIIEWIEDAGESAKTLNRLGLQRALTMLRTGKADGLLIAKLDRLTRSVRDWQTLIDGYFGERPGKQLFSVSDSIDTRSPAGRLVLNMLLAVAQWEREETAERTKLALRHKISKGERVGRVRYGYSVQDGQLVPVPAEQATIDAMRDYRAAGMTYRDIAATLTKEGIPTKEGKPKWSAAAVHRILSPKRVAVC